VAVLNADATIGRSWRLLAAGAGACLTEPLDVTRLIALLDERLTA
jgi:BarA-like signal transduction histidine kinase